MKDWIQSVFEEFSRIDQTGRFLELVSIAILWMKSGNLHINFLLSAFATKNKSNHAHLSYIRYSVNCLVIVYPAQTSNLLKGAKFMTCVKVMGQKPWKWYINSMVATDRSNRRDGFWPIARVDFGQWTKTLTTVSNP
mgnify:CR=1 FL=1